MGHGRGAALRRFILDADLFFLAGFEMRVDVVDGPVARRVSGRAAKRASIRS